MLTENRLKQKSLFNSVNSITKRVCQRQMHLCFRKLTWKYKMTNVYVWLWTESYRSVDVLSLDPQADAVNSGVKVQNDLFKKQESKQIQEHLESAEQHWATYWTDNLLQCWEPQNQISNKKHESRTQTRRRRTCNSNNQDIEGNQTLPGWEQESLVSSRSATNEENSCR